MFRTFFFFLLFFLPLITWAEDVLSSAPDQTGLTIYRATERGQFDLSDPEAVAEGIALVTEMRSVILPIGESTIHFDGVAQTLVPQSARIESVDGDITEANFDYRLISPGDIIANSIGQQVKVVRTQSKTGQITTLDATLVSGPTGVLLDINGHLEALDCAGENEKIIFSHIPENLHERPQLSVKVKTAHAGPRKIKLSYLATGFDWITRYVAQINPNNRTLDLTAWVTLVNQQNTSFFQSSVEVVAGNISRDEDTEAVETYTTSRTKACWYNRTEISNNILRKFAKPDSYDDDSYEAVEEIILSGARATIAEAHELGDYKLYSLPSPTDLHAHQIKQVRMLEATSIPFEKLYGLEFDTEDFLDRYKNRSEDRYTDNQVVPATTMIRLVNKKSFGLGKPLPSGDITVFEHQRSKQSTVFIGEDHIPDTPVGLPLEIKLGLAYDIEIQPIVVREYKTNKGDSERGMTDIQFTISNHKTESILFELKPSISLYEHEPFQIVKESAKHEMKNGVPVWRVQIPAGKQINLRYTLAHDE